MDIEELIKIIIDCAIEVRKHLKQGFEEKIYKNAMFLEMRYRGLEVLTEVAYEVRYKGTLIGVYRSDMVVNGCVVLELKANNALAKAHEVQLVNYLNAANIENGLLINFGGEKLEIKRKYRTYHPSSFSQSYTHQ
jgi:GxxExxY protein